MHFYITTFAVVAYLAAQSGASALPSQPHTNSIRGAVGPEGGAQDIIAKIGAVSDGLNGWAGAINNYKIGYLSLVPADKAEKATEAALDDATASVKKTKPLNDKENSAVSGQVAAMLPKVQAVAGALKEKAPIMIKEGVGGKVVEDAAGVQNKMDQLFASLQVVMTAQTQPGLRKAMVGVDKVFSQTQAIFSGGKMTSAELTNQGVAGSNQTAKASLTATISNGVSWRQRWCGITAVWSFVAVVGLVAAV